MDTKTDAQVVHYVMMEAESTAYIGQGTPRTAGNYQTLRIVEEALSPMALAITLIWDFYPPDCERLNLYCFKPLNVFVMYFVMAALEKPI